MSSSPEDSPQAEPGGAGAAGAPAEKGAREHRRDQDDGRGVDPGDPSAEVFDVADTQKVDRVVTTGIEHRQEWTRTILAIAFVALLALVIVLAFERAQSWEETKELLDVLLPAVTALIGSAVGFYFATRK